MTPTDFSAALTTLGWSHSELARRLACDTNLPSRWSRGAAAIPAPIATWLRASAAALARLPVPTDWRRR